MSIQIERIDSPIGSLYVATDGAALCALGFEGEEQALRAGLERRHPGLEVVRGPAAPAVAGALRAYFAGDVHALDAVPVRTGGTAFQQAVWTALRGIPAGETVSYAQMAARIGRPAAVRAVGAANGANPVPLVLPCHRVVGSDGGLTGYAGGLERKRWLLEHEASAALAPRRG